MFPYLRVSARDAKIALQRQGLDELEVLRQVVYLVLPLLLLLLVAYPHRHQLWRRANRERRKRKGARKKRRCLARELAGLQVGLRVAAGVRRRSREKGRAKRVPEVAGMGPRGEEIVLEAETSLFGDCSVLNTRT
jgi:hypothetical protein